MKPQLQCGEIVPVDARGVIDGWHEANTERPWASWMSLVPSDTPELPYLSGIRLHPKGHLYRTLDVAQHRGFVERYVRYSPLYLIGTGLALRELSDFEAKMMLVAESLPVTRMSDNQAIDLAAHLTLEGAKQLFRDAEKWLPASFWNAVGHQHGWRASWRGYHRARPQRT